MDNAVQVAGLEGAVGRSMEEVRWDPALRKPFFNSQGIPSVYLTSNKRDMKSGRPLRVEVPIAELQRRGIQSPVFNATSLRKEEWIELDRVVIKAARLRLRAWADLAASASYGGFNAFNKATLEYEAISDVGSAVVDFDARADGRNDMPLFKNRSIPLLITHCDFSFSSRQLGISRNGGSPMDTTLAEMAGRRVAEQIEKTLIGIETGDTFGTNAWNDGTSTVYGYTNFPYRLTKVNINAPSGGGWTPNQTVSDFLAMREQLYSNNFFGPFMVYTSTDWDQYLDADYIFSSGSGAATPAMTLRDRLRRIEGIQDIRRLDFLTATNSHAFTVIFVQMTPDVARAIQGMDITTLQWETKGGLELNFKVMAIQVPQLRADYNQRCGILHGRSP